MLLLLLWRLPLLLLSPLSSLFLLHVTLLLLLLLLLFLLLVLVSVLFLVLVLVLLVLVLLLLLLLLLLTAGTVIDGFAEGHCNHGSRFVFIVFNLLLSLHLLVRHALRWGHPL